MKHETWNGISTNLLENDEICRESNTIPEKCIIFSGGFWRLQEIHGEEPNWDILRFSPWRTPVPARTALSTLKLACFFGGWRETLPFPPAVFTIWSENNRREKLLRWARNEEQPRTNLWTIRVPWLDLHQLLYRMVSTSDLWPWGFCLAFLLSRLDQLFWLFFSFLKDFSDQFSRLP